MPPPVLNMLLPPSILQSNGKILFIAHLAIGDFTYLHNFFKALSEARPQLELHIWVDELRRTDNPAKWDALKKYSLYDWLAACPFFKKVYNKTYSSESYNESIAEARAENYPIVVSLASLRPQKYARLARHISPDGWVIGIKERSGLFRLFHYFAYKKLNATLPHQAVIRTQAAHITDIYNHWFSLLFGIELSPQQRFPELNIPPEWTAWAKKHIRGSLGDGRFRPLVFINTRAKAEKRCWPMSSAVQLIKNMQQTPAWARACFLLNAMPEDFEAVGGIIKQNGLDNAHVFSATDNFFQLPAMLAACDLVISVETSVMHLANAVHVPVLALMRRKNPEWAPIDEAGTVVIMPPRRAHWVKAISVENVMAALPAVRLAR